MNVQDVLEYVRMRWMVDDITEEERPPVRVVAPTALWPVARLPFEAAATVAVPVTYVARTGGWDVA